MESTLVHPVARVFQILFLLGGIGMFAAAFVAAPDNTWRSVVDFRYECTTTNTGTQERPRPKETCEDRGAMFSQRGTDEVMVSALAGVGLMIGAAAVSVGAARRPSAPQTLAPAAPHQYGGHGSFPTPPGHTPGAAR
ncbi:hypothetical protein ACWGI0_11880 [Streptomyces sp. NPDC054802]